MLRIRQMDERFLRHSEWTRRLGVASSVGLAGILSLPLLVFVVMPISLTSLSGPSTLLSLLGTFVVVYLVVCHTVELICAVPKNCVLYHFSFGSLGEFPAFLVGFLCLLDSLAVSSLLLSSWSRHVNLMFRRGLQPAMSVPILDRQDDSAVLSADFDLFAAMGVLFSLLILCCSLNVVSTVSICFLCVTTLIISSCTMVAFFHADPQNWIDAGFFKDGIRGLLRASAALMVVFSGVDSITSMVEETQKPRKRLPLLLVLLTFALAIAFFLIIMIFSLSVNVSSLSPSILVPDIFSSLNIPAARYMLTVASICGLSGAVLSSFLPASRILEAMTRGVSPFDSLHHSSSDGLLPLPRDSSSRSPIFAVISISLLLCASLLLRRDLLFDVVCTTTPLKMITTVCLTYLQHYLPEPLGIPQETSQYRTMGKRFSSMQDSMGESLYSMDSETVLHMNVAAIETDRLQRRLEKKQNKQYERERCSASGQYQSIPRSESPERPPSGLAALNGGHNCIGEPCSPDDELGHIFAREVPDLPYVCSFDRSPRPSSPSTMVGELRKATGILLLFMISSTVSCSILVSVDHQTTSSVVLLVLFLLLSAVSLILSGTVVRNDYLHRRDNKMPLFPYISLIVLFLLLFVLSATPLRAWIFLLSAVFSAFLLYLSFGRWFSVNRRSGGNGPLSAAAADCSHEESEEYRAIMGEECSEM